MPDYKYYQKMLRLRRRITSQYMIKFMYAIYHEAHVKHHFMGKIVIA